MASHVAAGSFWAFVVQRVGAMNYRMVELACLCVYRVLPSCPTLASYSFRDRAHTFQHSRCRASVHCQHLRRNHCRSASCGHFGFRMTRACLIVQTDVEGRNRCPSETVTSGPLFWRSCHCHHLVCTPSFLSSLRPHQRFWQ